MKAQSSTQGRKVKFALVTDPGSRVYVAGSFNNWDTGQYPMKDNPNSGIYCTVVPLPAGRHEYKFIVNGVWCTDPKCAESAWNEHGTMNSVRIV